LNFLDESQCGRRNGNAGKIAELFESLSAIEATGFPRRSASAHLNVSMRWKRDDAGVQRSPRYQGLTQWFYRRATSR